MGSSLEAHASKAETQLLNSGLFQFEPSLDKNTTSLCLQDQAYIENINEIQGYLNEVKKIVGPGCSKELLDVAVTSMSLLIRVLSQMSSKPKHHSSL